MQPALLHRRSVRQIGPASSRTAAPSRQFLCSLGRRQSDRAAETAAAAAVQRSLRHVACAVLPSTRSAAGSLALAAALVLSPVDASAAAGPPLYDGAKVVATEVRDALSQTLSQLERCVCWSAEEKKGGLESTEGGVKPPARRPHPSILSRPHHPNTHSDAGWKVRVYTGFGGPALSNNNRAESPRQLFGPPDARTLWLLVDPSSPNIINMVYVGECGAWCWRACVYVFVRVGGRGLFVLMLCRTMDDRSTDPALLSPPPFFTR